MSHHPRRHSTALLREITHTHAHTHTHTHTHTRARAHAHTQHMNIYESTRIHTQPAARFAAARSMCSHASLPPLLPPVSPAPPNLGLFTHTNTIQNYCFCANTKTTMNTSSIITLPLLSHCGYISIHAGRSPNPWSRRGTPSY